MNYIEIMLTHYGRVSLSSITEFKIGSSNVLHPVWHHAITWTNADDFSIGFQWIMNQNTIILLQENPFENTACKTAAILFRPQYGKDVMQDKWWVEFLRHR